ncbi:MAG: putative lipoprotein [Bacteroidetes bacterium]|jgi:hypothetical protein|nr:putative lipoprotein [Bacteroidota bacterium]
MKKLICLGIVIALAGCSKKESIESFSWLSGEWVGKYDSVPVFEQWKPLNGKLLDGRGGVRTGKDTVFTENIQIVEREDGIFYLATLKGATSAIEFKFSGFKNDTAVFENPTHDFPQRVLYFKNADGTFYACVDGKYNGKYMKEGFNYKRANDW